MKTIITTTAIAVTLSVAAGHAASAQAGIPLSPSIYVGGVHAVDQGTESSQLGFTMGAALDLGAARAVSVRAEASYTHFPVTGDTTEASDASARIDLVLAEHTSILAFTPYAVGGIGVYHVRASATQVDYATANGFDYAPVGSAAGNGGLSDGDNSGNKFGWNAGVGVEIPGGAIASRLELRYHRVSAAPGGDNTYLALTLGMRLVRF